LNTIILFDLIWLISRLPHVDHMIQPVILRWCHLIYLYAGILIGVPRCKGARLKWIAAPIKVFIVILICFSFYFYFLFFFFLHICVKGIMIHAPFLICYIVLWNHKHVNVFVEILRMNDNFCFRGVFLCE
jgi:hypothetical protein